MRRRCICPSSIPLTCSCRKPCTFFRASDRWCTPRSSNAGSPSVSAIRSADSRNILSCSSGFSSSMPRDMTFRFRFLQAGRCSCACPSSRAPLQQYLGAIEGRVKRGLHTNIVLLGESGIGKSYLLAWTMKSLMNTIKYYENPLNESPTPKDFPHYWNVEYTTGQTLGRRYKACDSYRSTESKRDVCNVYAYCDLFMLDEGGRVSTTYEKEALFDIMDEREKSCIISANFKSLDEMQDYYGDACMDRIRQNMVVPNTEGCASMRGSTELSQDRDLTEMQDFGDGVSEQFTDDVPF